MISLAQANFHSATGEFAKNQEQEVRAKSNVRVDTVVANTAGVSLPEFSLRGLDKDRLDDKELLGITGGGALIQECRRKFHALLELLMKIASLQTQFFTLEEVIKVTNRRVNALKHVVIPSIEDTIEYIKRELDEQDREDFFRLKRVQDKKKIEKEQKLREKELAEREGKATTEEADQETAIFDEDSDEEIVF
jgi:V-type H+-transporting ATPase subunit D